MLLSFASGVIANLSVDSGGIQIISEGHGGKVIAMVSHPTIDGLIATIAEDNVLRVWDVLGSASVGSRLVGALLMSSRPTAISFVNGHSLLISIYDDTNASIVPVEIKELNGSEENALSFKFSLIASDAVAISNQRITCLTVSPDLQRLVALGDDGAVHFFDVESSDFSPATGTSHFVLASGHKVIKLSSIEGKNVAKVSCDFSADSKILRTFERNNWDINGKSKVTFFDMGPVPMEISDAGDIDRDISKELWATTSSPVAPEAKGLNYIGDKPSYVTSLFRARKGLSAVLIAGYDDGSTRLFRCPATAEDSPHKTMSLHSNGPVLVTVTGNLLVSTGVNDGSLMVWEIGT
jgi:hypothetical protein